MSQIPCMGQSKLKLPKPVKTPHVGDKVYIAGDRIGILRFVGTVLFADGIWCGVELLEPNGKNNGEVQGVRYFDCPDNYGVFASKNKVTLYEDEKSQLMSSKILPTKVPPKAKSFIPSPCKKRRTFGDISNQQTELINPVVTITPTQQRTFNDTSESMEVLRQLDSGDQRAPTSDSDSSKLLDGTYDKFFGVGSSVSTINNSSPVICKTYDDGDLDAGCDIMLDVTFDKANVTYGNSSVSVSSDCKQNVSNHQLPEEQFALTHHSPTQTLPSDDHRPSLSELNETFDFDEESPTAQSLSKPGESPLMRPPASHHSALQDKDDNEVLACGTPSFVRTSVPDPGNVSVLPDLVAKPTPSLSRLPTRGSKSSGSLKTPSKIGLYSRNSGSLRTPSTGSRPSRSKIMMSTPCHQTTSQDTFEFDEELMAREAALVLAAIQQAQEQTDQPNQPDQNISDSVFLLNNSSQNSESKQEVEVNINRTNTIDQHDDCSPQEANVMHDITRDIESNICNTTRPVINSNPLNTTQTIGVAAHNTTHTVDASVEDRNQDVHNTTHTVDASGEYRNQDVHNTTHTVVGCPLETTDCKGLNSTHLIETKNPLDVTSVVESGPSCQVDSCNVDVKSQQLDTTRTIEEDNHMAMSVDEITASSQEKPEIPPTGQSSQPTSADDTPADDTSNRMQVDEVKTAENVSENPIKLAPDNRRKTLPPGSKIGLAKPRETKAQQLRKSLAPTIGKAANKVTEKKEPPKIVQKSKPKSKWADISKQIEQNKTTKPPCKPTESKLPAGAPDIDEALRKAAERRDSVGSEMSAVSQTSHGSKSTDRSQANSMTSKKPLKRQSLLPPSSAVSKRPAEFKKPRASLLPPSTKPSAHSKLSTLKSKPTDEKVKPPAKNLSPPRVTSSTGRNPEFSDNNVVSDVKKSNAAKPLPKGEKINPRVVTDLQNELSQARTQLSDKQRLVDGLRTELSKSCQGFEGLAVALQHLHQQLDEKSNELVKSKQEATSLTMSYEEERANYQNETELLTKNHEEEKQTVISRLNEQHDRELTKIKTLHAKEVESVRDELSHDYQEQMKVLQSEIETLKVACESWKVKHDQVTEALHKDADARLQMALLPYKQLPHEIESLKAVIEMKSAENRELRAHNNVLSQKCEAIPDLEKKLCDTEQRCENVQALLDIVSQKERETAEKYHFITRQAQQEKKENHRLSLNCEALALKLEEAEFTNSLHITNNSDLDSSTMSLPPYSIESPETSPSQFSRSFVRTSLKRRSKRNSSSSNTSVVSKEIPEIKLSTSPESGRHATANQNTARSLFSDGSARTQIAKSEPTNSLALPRSYKKHQKTAAQNSSNSKAI